MDLQCINVRRFENSSFEVVMNLIVSFRVYHGWNRLD